MFNTHYQVMDIENEPIAWDPSDHNVSFPWGMPACQAWYEEATLFEGATVSEASKPQPLTLKNFCPMGHLAAKSGIFIARTCDWWCSFAFAA